MREKGMLVGREIEKAENAVINPVSGLTDRQTKALALRYGLVGYRPHSQRLITELFGCSRQNVSELLRRAARKVREWELEPVEKQTPGLTEAQLYGLWFTLDEDFEINYIGWRILRKEQGIQFIWQLVGWTRKDLLRLRGFGKKTLFYVESALAEYGLKLGMELPEIPPPLP